MTQSPPLPFLNCPWCDSRNANGAHNCAQCGGPLPPPVGSDPGEQPPPPPRALPKGYRSRVMFRNTPLLLIGSIFTLIGLPFACIFPIVGVATGLLLFVLIGGLIGGLFVVIGLAMAYSGYRTAEGKIRPFQFGVPAKGTVVDVHQDTSITVNGRSPYAVVYQFEVHGRAMEGTVLSWKYAPQLQAPGNVVWVLYMQDDPTQNVIYPPVV
ncbi:MAG: DUF3592 domain-containing protein [Anaerolineales bacterium]|jgi:hypothetical protein|nr:DUF3592 domain-containing protein [Anaerolineales bacterium]